MTGEETNEHPCIVLKQSETEHGHYPLMWGSLPEGTDEYARRVLNETEENRVRGIRKLKEFVKKEKLTCPDDTHLIMVLRSCKYNIEKSKDKLKRYLKTRRLIIRQLAEIDMEKIKLILDDMFCVFLPYRDKSGRTIAYTRAYANQDNYRLEDVGYVHLASVLYVMSHPMTQIYGISYIASATCESLLLFYNIIKVYKNLAPKVLDFPFRVGRIDIVNELFWARWVFALVRPLLPEKIRKRVFFHGNKHESLCEIYHPDVLPEDVGGTWDPLSNKNYRKELIEFLEQLKSENCR